MRSNLFLNGVNLERRRNGRYCGMLGTAFMIVLFAVVFVRCTKESGKDLAATDPAVSALVANTYPANLADAVVVDPVIAVSFKSTATPADLSASTITLKSGTIPVEGSTNVSGKTLSFTPLVDLKPDTKYTAMFSMRNSSISGKYSSEHTWSFTTGKKHSANSLSVVSVLPVNGGTEVAIDFKPLITFNKELTTSLTKLVSVSLMKGTAPVAATISYSGNVATLIPAATLAANTVYTAKVVIKSNGKDDNDDDDDDDDEEEDDKSMSDGSFLWSFTTAGGGSTDLTAPTVVSVVPANNATSVAVGANATATFSESMNATTITATTFTLKQGTTAVPGAVTYSGTTATFNPTADLAAGTLYTATVTTGAKDAAGNAIASNYTWSFTTAAATADVTLPTVVSVSPANDAATVILSANATATFSESMNATTITATTFTLKQGTTAVAGAVTYSGTTATFNPTADLAAGTVYTATITTGAKDAAGNAIASNYTWSFTTAAATVTVSWSGQVWPILQSKCMSCHSGTSPRAGISIVDYASVSKLSNSQIDNPGMYSYGGVTAAEQATIKAWINGGRLNN